MYLQVLTCFRVTLWEKKPLKRDWLFLFRREALLIETALFGFQKFHYLSFHDSI